MGSAAHRPPPTWRTPALLLMLGGAGAGVAAHSAEYRIPTWAVLAFAAVQLCLLAHHLTRLNVLTALYGFVLTGMLIVGELLQAFSENLTYDGYLTVAQFTDRLNAQAMNVLVAASCLYHACAVAWGARNVWEPKQGSHSAAVFARQAWAPALAVSVVLIAATVGGTTIMQHPYATVEHHKGTGIESSGLSLGAMYLLVMALVWAVRAFGYRSSQTLTVVLVGLGGVLFFKSLRGERGGTLIFLGAALFVFYMYSSRPRWQRNLLLAAGALAGFAYFQALGHARATAAYEGLLPSLAEGYQRNVWGLLFPEGGFDPTRIQLLPAGYWHLLHSIDLYDQGTSLGGGSFYDLVPQAVPEFVSSWLGYERPLNASWRLAEYRANAGGFFLIAEGYWNFGVFGALLVAAALARAATAFEHWLRGQDIVFVGPYLGLAGLFMFGMFYSLQTMVRGWEISVVMVLLVRLLIPQVMRTSARGP